MREFSRSRCRDGSTIVLVPTMGALHRGHLTLARAAKEHGDQVVVSIFVNKTQFGPEEDYSAYPRTLNEDCKKLEEEDLATAVFAPSHREMYLDGDPKTWVTVDRLTDHLCGTSRPGHFRGVATIVTKLFSICQPTAAVFGLKDAQQFYVIRKLTADLNLGVEVVGVQTVREEDGLALSSRNQYLTPEERTQAPILYKAVSSAKELVKSGIRDGGPIREQMLSHFQKASLGQLDYAEIVNSDDFYPIESFESGMTVVAAAAVYFGSARLIDNQIIQVP
ncbi:MAG: pantoate--beta-alanine ligase [Rhodothermia bacterium]|nr:MAG: pantoate--beta-alanine ligase [Rhodothermia bacterium]